MTETYRSPLYGVQEQQGAAFADYDGWLWTTTYGDPVGEYEAVRSDVGIWDNFGLQKWEVRGADALAAVQRTFAGDVSTLAVGQARYAPFVDPSGVMVDEGTVYRHGDEHWWMMTNSAEFDAFLAEHALGLAYTMERRTLEMPVVAVQGPQSRTLLQGLTDADLSALRYFRFLPERVRVAGIPVWLLRTGFSGELGFELIPGPDDAVALWGAVQDAGARPFALDAVEMLRVEAGLVIVGVDYEPGATSPYDVSMDSLIALDSDAEFVGKDALRAVAANPPNRFKTLLVQGSDVPEYGAPVYRGEDVVGTCTSPTTSPRFGVIGLAVLRSDQAADGNVLEVGVGESGDGRAKATVTGLSVHDPEKRKPRS